MVYVDTTFTIWTAVLGEVLLTDGEALATRDYRVNCDVNGEFKCKIIFVCYVGTLSVYLVSRSQTNLRVSRLSIAPIIEQFHRVIKIT